MTRPASTAAAVGSLFALCMLAGCAAVQHPLEVPGRRAAVTTGGPWSSLTYAARLDSGVVVVDLGWDPGGRHLRRTLGRLDAAPADVAAVFLTHAHRDHVAGWRHVRRATFHVGAPEVPLLLGHRAHGGWLARLVDRLAAPDLPSAEEIRLLAFTADTAFAFGADTVFAFLVPGHTAGSAAYLIGDVLLVGDAMSSLPLLGFRPARRVYSEDVARSSASIRALAPRLAGRPVRLVCTAHAKCGPPAALWAAAASG